MTKEEQAQQYWRVSRVYNGRDEGELTVQYALTALGALDIPAAALLRYEIIRGHKYGETAQQV